MFSSTSDVEGNAVIGDPLAAGATIAGDPLASGAERAGVSCAKTEAGQRRSIPTRTRERMRGFLHLRATRKSASMMAAPMTDSIQAVYMTAPGRPLELRSVPAPRPREGGAILETVASEVCGTDVHLHHGRLSGVPYPIIPGHVSVGRVLETNGSVADVEGRPIASGTLVTFYDVYGTCGTCWHCLVARAATRCPNRRVYGITAPSADGLLGGWSERIEILPGVKLVPLPDGI